MFAYNFKRTVLILIALFFFCVGKSDAASLWIESNASNVKVGDVFTATVYVNANNTSINNVESQISSSNLEILSVSNSGSILNMWVEQPTFTSKITNFNGGVLNPGYSGSSGKVISVSLKAIKEGVGGLNFDSASVRANDGLGTDVLKSKNGLSVNISSNIIPVIEPTPISTPVPDAQNTEEPAQNTKINSLLNAPIIYSSATPNPDMWYNVDKTTFTWEVPHNAVALKTLLGSHSDSEPTVLYDSVIKSKTIEDIPDGVWYFHLKYKTTDGWSKTAHKKFKIDTTSPESITLKQETLETGMIKINLASYDKTSYITKFVLNTPQDPNIEVTDITKEGNATYVFPATYEGLKEITVKAFDSANNVYEEKFSIDFPKVSIPEITTYPSEVKKGDSITVSGKSKYPKSKAELKFVLSDGKVNTYTTTTKEDGSFDFQIPVDIVKGELSASVSIYVGDSQIPVSSEKVVIKVDGLNSIQIGKNILNILLIIVPILILIALLIGVLYFVGTRLMHTSPDNERQKRIKHIEKEVTDLIDSLKALILQDIHLVGADRNIQDIEEAESVLLKNLLKDFKDIEKRISSRLKRGRVTKKKVEVEEE
ncbi:MAG: hypothetical protein RLY49_334 [Candidatus Parcubacteria bacterium]|jgi:hypothetical protein